MARVTYSAASTFLAKRGSGQVYGITVSPAAGGTVVVADLADAGAVPNLGIPSTFGPSLIAVAGPFPASPIPVTLSTFGQQFSTGLTISIASTQIVTVFYD